MPIKIIDMAIIITEEMEDINKPTMLSSNDILINADTGNDINITLNIRINTCFVYFIIEKSIYVFIDAIL